MNFIPTSTLTTADFQDAETGAHTNSMKGIWNALKYQIAPRNKTQFLEDDGNIVENIPNDNFRALVWRREYFTDQCACMDGKALALSRISLFHQTHDRGKNKCFENERIISLVTTLEFQLFITEMRSFKTSSYLIRPSCD
ncbi:hypothetical protein RF11_10599 [Thelohanellus kitauei]|uniref:Uncharacterized protein n=1 Tax=Thelohanellus kitauei TaxID=669202 RepID=A0A0C2MTN5_THEKT|nr:hypothetical protein RF11_10599 [Thelohanellus kitauei]